MRKLSVNELKEIDAGFIHYFLDALTLVLKRYVRYY